MENTKQQLEQSLDYLSKKLGLKRKTMAEAIGLDAQKLSNALRSTNDVLLQRTLEALQEKYKANLEGFEYEERSVSYEYVRLLQQQNAEYMEIIKKLQQDNAKMLNALLKNS